MAKRKVNIQASGSEPIIEDSDHEDGASGDESAMRINARLQKTSSRRKPNPSFLETIGGMFSRIGTTSSAQNLIEGTVEETLEDPKHVADGPKGSNGFEVEIPSRLPKSITALSPSSPLIPSMTKSASPTPQPSPSNPRSNNMKRKRPPARSADIYEMQEEEEPTGRLIEHENVALAKKPLVQPKTTNRASRNGAESVRTVKAFKRPSLQPDPALETRAGGRGCEDRTSNVPVDETETAHPAASAKHVETNAKTGGHIESPRRLQSSIHQQHNPQARAAFQDFDEDISEDDGPASPTEEHSVNESAIFDTSKIERMLAISLQVGHTFDKRNQEWVLRKKYKAGKFRSSPGARLVRTLEDLSESYEALKDQAGSAQTPSFSESIESIPKLIKELKDEIEKIMAGRLGSVLKGIELDTETRTKSILTDLYFRVFPAFLGTVQVSTRIFPLRSSMDIVQLKHTYELVDMFYRLARVALDQPPSHQPVPVDKKGMRRLKSDSYRISKPTSSIISDIRELRSKLLATLERRHREESLDRQDYQRQVMKSKRAERERREQARKRRQDDEIYRQQSRDLERALADPEMGYFAMQEIAKESKRARGRARTYSTRTQDTQENSDRLAGNRRGVDDDYRVRIFGNNNKGYQSASQLWSREERLVLAEFLRTEAGPDRYGRLAEKLGRSMDDVFACAKELQEVLDTAHENGKHTGERYEWTYGVWIDPDQHG